MSYAPKSLSYLDGIAQATMNIAVDITMAYNACNESTDPAENIKARGLREALAIIEKRVNNAN
jgi:hypothetical protein